MVWGLFKHVTFIIYCALDFLLLFHQLYFRSSITLDLRGWGPLV